MAMAAAKLTRLLLRVCGREASCTPGKVALKICPDFMGGLRLPETVICVTGTNGKTTTSNLITTALTKCGYTVTNNSYGSNIQAGVCSALIKDSRFSGKSRRQIAVLEVDERSSLLVYKYITPDYLVITNIMRDSLKRNAHTDFISYIINRAVPERTRLVLNADDFICSRLCPGNPDRVFFGISAEKPETSPEGALRDVVYCPECGSALRPEYVRYDHIGRIVCPGCGLSNPAPDYEVTQIDRSGGSFTVSHAGVCENYRLVNDNIVNVYNLCAAVAVLREFGLDASRLAGAFEKTSIVSSRYERVKAGRLNIVMQLAKGQNPVACARAFSYVVRDSAPRKAVLVMVDDKNDNTNDSESVCWIYDCDYSALADPSVKQLVFAGRRCRDQRLRALLAGVDPSVISISDSLFEGAAMIDTDACPDIYVCFDPYILAEAEKIKKYFADKGETEK
jgi:UDP-N-acetylmuramyl tripeptide synthase